MSRLPAANIITNIITIVPWPYARFLFYLAWESSEAFISRISSISKKLLTPHAYELVLSLPGALPSRLVKSALNLSWTKLQPLH
jgi:hypothetical protein